jgi:hypothetical protein
MTVRDAVTIALEVLPGELEEWVSANRTALRAHVRAWVHEFALARGVILEDRDIDSELTAIIAERRARRG